jgi:multicomponent Na+:H+ antiporter subunit F
MTDTALLIGAMLVTASMIAVGLYRVFAGPTVFDRLVAIALLSVNGVILLVFIGFAFDRPSLFLDIALAFALLAFLLPIALGRYFEDRDDGTSSDGAPSIRSRPSPLGIIPHGLFAERGRRLQEQEAARRAVGTSPRRDRSAAPPRSGGTDATDRPESDTDSDTKGTDRDSTDPTNQTNPGGGA